MYPCDFRHLRGKKPATPATSTILSNQGHDVGTPARSTEGKSMESCSTAARRAVLLSLPMTALPSTCLVLCQTRLPMGQAWGRHGMGPGWLTHPGTPCCCCFLTKKKTEPQALLCVQLHYRVTRMFCSACESTGRGQSLRTHSAPGRHRRCYI